MLNSIFKSSPRDRQEKIAISVVVVAYDMDRELPRTLQSLARSYQRLTDATEYEVIVVDNGSPTPVNEDMVGSHGPEFNLLRIDDAPPSPAQAINRGVELARGRFVALMVDGARMLSPGVLLWATEAFDRNARSLVSVLGLHLGPAIQRDSVKQGYSKSIEDRLLERIDWPNDGYRLFEISCLAGSSILGWAGPMAESNCLLLPRALFEELGGFEERFVSPGGGLVNLDFYRRCCEARDVHNVYLVGEGCFHQLHGGVTTGDEDVTPLSFDDFLQEYREIRGHDYAVPQKPAMLLGELPACATHLLAAGAHNALRDRHDAQSVHESHMTAVGLHRD